MREEAQIITGRLSSPDDVKSFARERYATPTALVSEFFVDEEDYVLLNLPSNPRDRHDLFDWSRESI